MSISDSIAARIKVKVYKPLKNPDDRLSLCGEPVQTDEEGRQFFIIPSHQAKYQKELHAHYEFGEEFEIEEKKKAGRPAKEV